MQSMEGRYGEMNLIASIILMLASFLSIFSFSGQEAVVQDDLQAALEQVAAPDMSILILDASEEEQLAWLTEIHQFEEHTLRSQSSGLTEQDIRTIEAHLSQVFGPVQVRLILVGYYRYDPETGTYDVPDGDWFMASFDVDTWPSSEVAVTERSEQAATLLLKGIDWKEDARVIQFEFSISDGRLWLERRTFLS